MQAVRNASDLTVMSCPVKYREIGDFHSYYSGAMVAPYLTIFVGGNHEASSHLWELFYGGWVAPNIYYMGAANVLRLGGVRIAGMSGIWKGYNFRKPHHERLPYNQDDVKTFYHVREYDIRKLLQLRTQVDIGISHDWPRAIEKHGDQRALFRAKPDFEQESKDGSLGNQAATWVMDRLRPLYWFAAHMHCRFAAVKRYEDDPASNVSPATHPSVINGASVPSEAAVVHNENEIDLDMDDDDETPAREIRTNGTAASKNQDEISLEDNEEEVVTTTTSSVPSDLRAQLPAAFASPSRPSPGSQPGQPAPLEVTNKTVRFLALDKCLPGRKFLQLQEIVPQRSSGKSALSCSKDNPKEKPKFEYDPEWLAITRVFASDLILGDKFAQLPPDLGESHYRSLIEKEQVWVEENIVKPEKLEIPANFVITADPFIEGSPEIVNEGPLEYSNPQTQTYCDLLGIENKFHASDEERAARIRNGPRPAEQRQNGRGRGGGGGGGRGGRGRGRGRGGRTRY